jgi:hypothetical protein
MDRKHEKQIQTEIMKSEVNGKRSFVEPKLVKHGDVKDITATGKHGPYYP